MNPQDQAAGSIGPESSDAVAAGVSPDDQLRLGIELGDGWVRVAVEDPGHGGMIAARDPDLPNGGGFGLNIVRALAARWGALREGSTCVWAELTWPTGALVGGETGCL
jgi:hypothetical protein